MTNVQTALDEQVLREDLAQHAVAVTGSLEVRFAQDQIDVAAAQALRFRVFFEEMQAQAEPVTQMPRRDFDPFDDICDHLLVVDHDLPPEEAVVGTNPNLADTDGDGHNDKAELDAGTGPTNAFDYPGYVPPQDLQFSYGGKQYEIVVAGQTWAASKAAAQAKGGYLAQIDDAAEKNFLVNKLNAAAINTVGQPQGHRMAWVDGSYSRALSPDTSSIHSTSGEQLLASIIEYAAPPPPDADNDGLTDAEEAALGTNPNLADTDGDGHNDKAETLAGTSPTDPLDYTGYVPPPVVDPSPPANLAPTNLVLSNDRLSENQPVGTFVGLLSATDQDGDPLTFSFVENGSDGIDNPAFSILGNELRSLSQFDYENKQVAWIRVRAEDGRGGSVEQSFVIRIQNTFIGIVRTLAVENVGPRGALAKAQVLADGWNPITETGIIVSQSFFFDLNDPGVLRFPATTDPLGNFQAAVNGLKPGERYYCRAYLVNAEGVSYGARKRFQTTLDNSTPWKNAIALGNGWYEVPWLGKIYLAKNGWAFHQDGLGWIYAADSVSNGNWMWSAGVGWLWTSPTTYPYMWSHGSSDWWYFLARKQDKRVFFAFGPRAWMER